MTADPTTSPEPIVQAEMTRRGAQVARRGRAMVIRETVIQAILAVAGMMATVALIPAMVRVTGVETMVGLVMVATTAAITAAVATIRGVTLGRDLEARETTMMTAIRRATPATTRT